MTLKDRILDLRFFTEKSLLENEKARKTFFEIWPERKKELLTKKRDIKAQEKEKMRNLCDFGICESDHSEDQ